MYARAEKWLIQAHNNRLEILLLKPRGEFIRGLQIRTRDAHSIKLFRFRYALDRDPGVIPLEPLLELICGVSILECSHLHHKCGFYNFRHLENCQFYGRDARPNQVNLTSSSNGKINHPAINKWSSIVDPHIHLQAIRLIRDSDKCIERQRAMRGRHVLVRIKHLAARRLSQVIGLGVVGRETFQFVRRCRSRLRRLRRLCGWCYRRNLRRRWKLGRLNYNLLVTAGGQYKQDACQKY
jgi:hypothetical protein